jgi:hypothetical protein
MGEIILVRIYQSDGIPTNIWQQLAVPNYRTLEYLTDTKRTLPGEALTVISWLFKASVQFAKLDIGLNSI